MIELLVEWAVRWTFRLRREVTSAWERCIEEEQSFLAARLTPEEIAQRAIEEAFQARSRSNTAAAAAGVMRVRREQERRKNHEQ